MAQCATCRKTLTLLIGPDDDDDDEMQGSSSSAQAVYVDDDVELNCGCRFHWDCLLSAVSIENCSSCGKNIVSTGPDLSNQLLCNIKNEGGLQENIDILPILSEEVYLKAYPEERRCRAFLGFCIEGDEQAIVDLLNDTEDDGEDSEPRNGTLTDTADVVRYQDTLGSMSSGLHLAIENQRPEVAWLLLLLGSTLEMNRFPGHVLVTADKLGVARQDQDGRVDIRSLKDAEGFTAEQRASVTGGVWDQWLTAGLLSASS